MFGKLQVRRSTYSSWFLVVFMLVLAISASISEFFQAPNLKTHELARYRLLIPQEFLSRIKTIHFKNRLGDFSFERNFRGWELTSPRKLPANAEQILNIVKSLGEIKIKKIYNKDIINLSNFSLNSPPIEIKLRDESEEEIEVKFGLVNPIDKSTYALLSQKDAIYHVDSINYQMESLDLTSFVNSKIFSMNTGEINKFSLFRGKSENKQLQLGMAKKENIWKDARGKEMNGEKIHEYLNALTSLKSTMILDKINEPLEKKINQLLKNPLYTIKINTSPTDQIVYTISHLINSLPTLKLEKRQNFLIRSSNRRHPYILPKDSLQHFYKRQKHFRKLPFKKLFY